MNTNSSTEESSLSSLKRRLIKKFSCLIRLNDNIIFTHFVKRIFELILDIIQTHQDKTIENGHHIFKLGGEIVEGTGKVRTVDNRKRVNKNFTVGPKSNGCAIAMYDTHVVKSNDHLTNILAHPGYFSTLNSMGSKLHSEAREFRKEIVNLFFL